jgi:nitrogen fixation NifU-like protein
MHSERLLEHFQNPQNVGELPPPALTVEVTNPACGDLLRLSVQLEGDRVAQANYRVRGCTASIAAGSALTVWLQGRSSSELKLLTPSQIEEELGGLEPASKHAAVLAVDAVKRLISLVMAGTLRIAPAARSLEESK